MSCPICENRAAKRFCPAKGEKICATCCGEQREVTIDCPQDCSHLAAARRYQAENHKGFSAEEFPYSDVQFPEEFVYDRWPVISGLAGAILAFQLRNKDLNDTLTIAAVEALAETFRTLGTGIIYERPPDAPLPRALYRELAELLRSLREQSGEASELPLLVDSDVFRLLVFFLRLSKLQTNGRPHSRALLEFLRTRFPLPEQAAPKEASRIIVP